MAKGQTYDQMMEVIREQEAELRTLRHALRIAEGRSGLHQRTVRAVDAISHGLLTLDRPEAMLALVTDALVTHLAWDAAVVAVRHDDGQVMLLAPRSLTQRHLSHLQEWLGQDPYFAHAYEHQELLSTLGRPDAQSLPVRVLFHADEAAAAPIASPDHVHGYLVACSYTREGRQRTPDDAELVANLASLLGRGLRRIQISFE